MAVMEKGKVMRKNPNMIKRIIGNETILVPIYKTSREISCIYTLNQDAAWILEIFDGKTSLSDIKKRICRKFDLTSEEADKKLDKFLKELQDIKAVV